MPKKQVRTVKDVVDNIRATYIRWKTIYNEGCSDPSWEDGMNLNLLRGHCTVYKREIETILGDKYYLYPDEYFWPVPPEVPSTFMAKKRELKCRGVVLEASEREFEVTW